MTQNYVSPYIVGAIVNLKVCAMTKACKEKLGNNLKFKKIAKFVNISVLSGALK